MNHELQLSKINYLRRKHFTAISYLVKLCFNWNETKHAFRILQNTNESCAFNVFHRTLMILVNKNELKRVHKWKVDYLRAISFRVRIA